MRWAQVTQVSPVRVQLNGDTTPLPYTPPSAVNLDYVSVDEMVMVDRVDSLYVIVGRSGGDGFTVPDGSATVRGLLELATVTEAEEGEDSERAVTAEGVKAVVDAAVASLQAILDATPLPYRVAAGYYYNGSNISNGAGVTISIALPAGRFTQPPIVTATVFSSARNQIAVTAVSTSTFDIRLDNFSGGTAFDRAFYWEAKQMTSGSAAG